MDVAGHRPGIRHPQCYSDARFCSFTIRIRNAHGNIVEIGRYLARFDGPELSKPPAASSLELGVQTGALQLVLSAAERSK